MADVTTYRGAGCASASIAVARLTGRDRAPRMWTFRTTVGPCDAWRENFGGRRQARSRAATKLRALRVHGAAAVDRGGGACQVIAPALMPRKPGDRVKTDRRDARKLVELLRAGLLTEVHPPTPAEEAARDLVRARDDARVDRQRCRHRYGETPAAPWPPRPWPRVDAGAYPMGG